LSNVYYVGEAIAAPESAMSTGTVELTAKKLMVDFNAATFERNLN